MPIELDTALIRLDKARDHVENGCLAGPVGSEKANGLAALHRQTDIAHNGATAEALGNRSGGEKSFRRCVFLIARFRTIAGVRPLATR
jgi:hypothetical protein